MVEQMRDLQNAASELLAASPELRDWCSEHDVELADVTPGDGNTSPERMAAEVLAVLRGERDAVDETGVKW